VSGPSDLAGLLAACLRAAGATRAFRAAGHALPPLPGLEVVDVAEPELAVLLADADGHLARAPSPRPGVALLPGARLRLSSQPGAPSLVQRITEAEVLAPVVAGWSLGEVHAALDLELELDLRAPVPPGVDALTLTATEARLVRLSEGLAELDTVILVGPGVVRAGEVAGVAEAARHTGAPVVATAGALGVLPLTDPAWRGVVGLQARDGALAGLDASELVVAAGLDAADAGVLPADAQVLEVEPWHLGLMAHHWSPPDRSARAPRRELVDGLAAVAAAGAGDERVPLHPVRALADLAGVLGPDALVVADPGPVGLWLGRGVVARPPGTAVVPSLAVRGFAAAAALVAGLDGRPAAAVVAAPSDPATDALLDLAAALGVAVVCEVWGEDATWSGPAEHRERLVGARHEGGVQRLSVPVDWAPTEELVALAGPVVAWPAAEAGGPADGPAPG
jgi:hypothetical protein